MGVVCRGQLEEEVRRLGVEAEDKERDCRYAAKALELFPRKEVRARWGAGTGGQCQGMSQLHLLAHPSWRLGTLHVYTIPYVHITAISCNTF